MTQPQYGVELDTALALARRAGAAIEEVRREGFEALEKHDCTPVTAADLRADSIIRAGLMSAFPEDSLLTEESAKVTGGSGRVWIVDPLDGTEAFIDGTVRGYAVQIGLLVDGVATLGVVYESRHDRMLHAIRGGDAVSTDANGARPVRVSARRELAGRRLVTSTTIGGPLKSRLLGLGLSDGGGLRSVGIKVGELVCDRADVYVSHHPVHAWDIVAPLVILEAAGGGATDLAGGSFTFDGAGRILRGRGPFVASNGLDHDQLCAALRSVWEAP